jgi:branched-chain amino acid transport system permease protein
MDFSIASILALDGATNGAIYALLALATVLVFAVTRVIFIPQGEFVAFGALTLAMLQQGLVPGTVWFLLVMAGAGRPWPSGRLKAHLPPARLLRRLAGIVVYPVAISLVAIWAAPLKLPLLLQALLTLALVTPFGPLIYRLAYQSLADASVLVLLIVSVGVHFAHAGPGPVLLRCRGLPQPQLLGRALQHRPAHAERADGDHLPGVGGADRVAVAVLRAHAAGQGAAGHSRQPAGRAAAGDFSPIRPAPLTFTVAAFIGALSGLLIGPTTTVFYDSGFLIGLKGFVAAVIAGLSSYPGALIGALFVGIVEAFGAFWASAFKEVIVFTIILPVLLVRSLRSGHSDEDH